MKKLTGIVLFCLLFSWIGLQSVQAVPYTKPNYKVQHWDIALNAVISAVQTDITTLFAQGTNLSSLINNWAIEDNIVTLITATPTYSSGTAFTLSGDYTTRFTAGKVVQAQVAAGMVYSTVASSSYASPNTTVNLNDSVLTNPITRVYVVATRDGLWPNGPGYVVARDYGTGLADLQAADAVAAAAGKELQITYAYAADDDVTLAAPRVTIMPGGSISIATTKTLTINGGFSAGDYQVFTCTGTGRVKFGTTAYADRSRIPVVNVLWFGAKGDNVTDDHLAFQYAFDTAPAASAIQIGVKGVQLEVPPGSYYINSTVYITQNSSIRARGERSITNIYAGAGCGTTGCFRADSTYNGGFGGDGTTIRGLGFTTIAPGYAIYAYSWPSLYIYDCWFNGGNHVKLDGTMDVDIGNCTFDGGDTCITSGATGNWAVRIHHNHFLTITTYMMLIDNAAEWKIENNDFHPANVSMQNCIKFYPSAGVSIKDIIISGNTFNTQISTAHVYSTVQSFILLTHVAGAVGVTKNIKVLNNTFRGSANYALRCADAYTDGIEFCGNSVDLSSSTVNVSYPVAMYGTNWRINNNYIKTEIGLTTVPGVGSIIYAGGLGTPPIANGQIINNTLYLQSAYTKTITTGFIQAAGDYIQIKNNTCLIESSGAGETLTVSNGIVSATSRTGISALLNPMRIVGGVGTEVLTNWVTFNTAAGNDKILLHGSGTATVNPVSMALGASSTMDVTVTGVALGDRLIVGPGVALAGVTYSASVKTTDTVTITFTNAAGANPLDLASSAWDFEWYR